MYDAFWIIVVPLFLLICISLVGRLIVLWYFRIDRAIELLESIDASLKELPAVRRKNFQEGGRTA